MMEGHVFDGGLDETRRRVIGKRWGIIGANPKAKTGTGEESQPDLDQEEPENPSIHRM